jgi:hypothetical protein
MESALRPPLEPRQRRRGLPSLSQPEYTIEEQTRLENGRSRMSRRDHAGEQSDGISERRESAECAGVITSRATAGLQAFFLPAPAARGIPRAFFTIRSFAGAGSVFPTRHVQQPAPDRPVLWIDHGADVAEAEMFEKPVRSVGRWQCVGPNDAYSS